jgi:hypothetical protein
MSTCINVAEERATWPIIETAKNKNQIIIIVVIIREYKQYKWKL